jgi:hypothetical protein
VTAVPLAEVAELNPPQVPAGVQLQVTPPSAESLATVALTGVVSFTKVEVGAAPMVTATGALLFEVPLHPSEAAIKPKVKAKNREMRREIA